MDKISADLQFARHQRSQCKRDGDMAGIRLWTEHIEIHLIKHVGVIVESVEYEHRCPDCNVIVWKKCRCESLDECKLYPLCSSCWTKRITPL